MSRVGVHSMRGVDHRDILRTVDEAPQDVPFHIHVSEQLKEVEDALAYLGKRPVEWLLDNVELNERFHLVHATHLTEDETERLAKTRRQCRFVSEHRRKSGRRDFSALRDYQSFGGAVEHRNGQPHRFESAGRIASAGLRSAFNHAQARHFCRCENAGRRIIRDYQSDRRRTQSDE